MDPHLLCHVVFESDIGPGLFPRLHRGEAAHYSGMHGVCLRPVGGAREGDGLAGEAETAHIHGHYQAREHQQTPMHGGSGRVPSSTRGIICLHALSAVEGIKINPLSYTGTQDCFWQGCVIQCGGTSGGQQRLLDAVGGNHFPPDKDGWHLCVHTFWQGHGRQAAHGRTDLEESSELQERPD